MKLFKQIWSFVVNFFKGIVAMSKDNRRPTKINTAEGPIIDIINSVDPLVYINSREQAEKNKNRSGGASGGGSGAGEQTPSHPALTYNLWATWWSLPSNVSSNLLYQHSGIVELLGWDGLNTIREVSDISGLPNIEYQKYLELCSRVPKGRRVLRDYYWQNPHYYKTYDDYYKLTSDGTTYTGGVIGFGDASPLKFQTPWATTSAQDTKVSFKSFLNRCKTDNVLFDYFWDDTEGLGVFSLGSNNNAYESTFTANGIPNDYETWQLTPDPRMTPAIVSDARFTSVLNQNGRTFSQEVVQKFRDLIGDQSDTRTASQILTYYTTVSDRQDFNPPWGQSNDIRMAYYAFDSALGTYNFGTIRKSCIHNSFTETNFPVTKIFQSDVAPISTTEVKFVLDMNGHHIPKDEISDYGASPHIYGQNNIFYSYGYHTNPTTDLERYRFSALGANVSSFYTRAHMSFIQDIQKVRGMLRTSPSSYQSFYPIVSTPSNTFNSCRYNEDPKYWYELMYHLCLHGAKFFNVFTLIHTEQEMQAVQTVLDEWKTISVNNHAIPASNGAGSTSTIVERINLKDAAESHLISGGYIPSVNKWIWRLTTPPQYSNYTLNDPSQTDLPQTINIPSGSRGVWIERSVGGKPDYVPTVVSYEVPVENNKRMFAEIGIGSAGSTEITWNNWTPIAISAYQGNPFPSGIRAYAWEGNPSNPEVSSPWHNMLYETTIDIYKWGSRAFSFYGPWGAEEEQPFWKPQQWKQLYSAYTGNNKTAPARWKGFKYAVRALLEGNMTPVGKDPINEPCNVHFYMTSTRGVAKLRNFTNNYWTSLGSTDAERDINYYNELDELIGDLIEAKGRTTNSGKLYISVGSAVSCATPKTVHLYRSGTGYKTDALELGDWYVMNRLKNNGIVHFFEARSERTLTQSPNSGAVGSESINEWRTNPMVCDEYWLWYSDPNNGNTAFDNSITNEETPLTMRLAGSFYPLPSTVGGNLIDPYQVKLTYIHSGQTRTLIEADAFSSIGLYTPSHGMFEFYKICDNYKKYNNMSGVVFDFENILSYNMNRYMSGNWFHPVYNGSTTDPLTNYWRLPNTVIHLRSLFDSTVFLQNPATYGAGNAALGFWTQAGKDYWDTNVRRSTFDGFIGVVHQYALNFCPPNIDTDCVDYGSSTDALTRNVIDLGNW